MKIKSKKIRIILSGVLPVLILGLFSFTQISTGEPWEVPEKFVKMKNPTTSNSANLKVGKMLYDQHCKSCHGKEGLGDGTKASTLETHPGDFTTEEFQEQTDGAIFYKITEGRDEMPSYSKKIEDDEDRWLVVNYLRTLE